MTENSSATLRMWVTFALFGIALTTGLVWSQASGQAATDQKEAKKPVPAWSKLSVELPTSDALFPPGEGADIANGQCLICHSAGMVLRQPPLTEDEWRSEINKMRSAFGALIAATQVDPLARYLHAINGRRPSPNPTALDAQQGS
jgi:cytochrome c5